MPEHPEFSMASNSSGDYIARDEHLGQNTKQLYHVELGNLNQRIPGCDRKSLERSAAFS